MALNNEDIHHITEINLPNSGLSGTLPPQLGQLEHLQVLNLRGNLIRGSIPVEITRLKELHTVDLTECQLDGTLPHYWASDKLDKLLLGQNGLRGEFFGDLSSPHLTSITEINLEQNNLDGTIKGESISSMEKLETLSLSQNNLSGVLPGKEIGSLATLKYLYLDSNHLVGTLSSQIAQQNKAHIEELWLQDNAFSGSVPASFIRLDKLHDFFIDGNKLTALPEDICGPNLNADFFEVEAAANGVTEATSKEKTYCDHIACPAGSVSLEGMHPCTKCAGTPEIARMTTPYIGTKATNCQNWRSQRDILKAFHEGATKNGPWKKDGNGVHDWDNDEMDICDFTGITCDYGSVTKIQLRDRGLSGTIAAEIGFLHTLEELDVSDNDLTGFLPSDLRWTDLTKLDISGNRIRGVVPPLLCLMEDLNRDGNSNALVCDRLACPSGSYNSQGAHFGSSNEGKCLPCYDDTPFIAQKSCTHKNNPKSLVGQFLDGSQIVIEVTKGHSTKYFFAVVASFGCLLFCFCALRVKRQKMAKERNDIEQGKITNHREVAPLRGYKDDDDISSYSSSDESSSSEESADEEQAVEMHTRNYGYVNQSKHYSVRPYSPRSDDSSSSSSSAPLQVMAPREQNSIASSLQKVSNIVRNRARGCAEKEYDTLDISDRNSEIEMYEADNHSDSDTTDSSHERIRNGDASQNSDINDADSNSTDSDSNPELPGETGSIHADLLDMQIEADGPSATGSIYSSNSKYVEASVSIQHTELSNEEVSGVPIQQADLLDMQTEADVLSATDGSIYSSNSKRATNSIKEMKNRIHKSKKKKTQSSAPDSPKRKYHLFKKHNANDRMTDINALISNAAEAPAFALLLAKILSFGAPGKFPSIESMDGMPFDDFDLDNAKGMIVTSKKDLDLSDELSAQVFANIFNCMMIDILDDAKGALKAKEKDDEVLIDAINIVLDFFENAASLFGAVAEVS